MPSSPYHLLSKTIACLLAVSFFVGEAWHLLPGLSHGSCCVSGSCHAHSAQQPSGCSHDCAGHRHSHHSSDEFSLAVEADNVAADNVAVVEEKASRGELEATPGECVICKILALRAIAPRSEIEISSSPLLVSWRSAEPVTRPREICLASAPRGPPSA